MKFQTCQFKTKQADNWMVGIAAVESIGVSDVKWIVDANSGKRYTRIYDYRLSSRPMQVIDTEYAG